MQNFYGLDAVTRMAASCQLSEFSNYVSRAAEMADSVRLVNGQMKTLYKAVEWSNPAYRLAESIRLSVPEYQLPNLAQNLVDQMTEVSRIRVNFDFAQQISALYGAAAEKSAFSLSTEMLNANVLNLTNTLRTSNITSIHSNATALANQLDSIWNESTYSGNEAATISLEDTRTILEEVKPLLPTEAVETINTKIADVKTPNNAISQKDWVGIISIIVTVLLFLAGQALSSEHDKKEEAFWAATNAYQQESLATQKEDVRLKQELLDYLKNSQSCSVASCDCSESVYDTEQHIVDSPNSQDNAENQDSIQATQQEQTDAED